MYENSVFVTQFDMNAENQIRTWNDGQLPIDWSLENLMSSHPSKPNNPDVANAFFRAGMIESWGRGIDKIINLCVSTGLPQPVFNTGFGGLQIEFVPKPEDLEMREKVIEKMTREMTEKTSVKMREEMREKISDVILNLIKKIRKLQLSLWLIKQVNLIVLLKET